MAKTPLFLSHSTADDALVRRLQQALADLGEDLWIDSRELRGGNLLWPVIQEAIDSAAAYAVLVSPAALQSEWVGDELAHALKVQRDRGPAHYPVIPLSLDGTRLGVLKQVFGTEPAYIPISSTPGGIDAALNAILTALGRRLPADVAPTPQPAPEPIEELVLELTDLRYEDLGAGVRRPSARARLVHEPGPGPHGAGQREVASARSWRLTAPLGPIEADDLRWYLEKYAIWPGTQFAERARRVEQDLARWGQDLHQAALPAEHTANVLQSWSRIGDRAARRFSVLVDWEAALETGATPEQTQGAEPGGGRHRRRCRPGGDRGTGRGRPWARPHPGLDRAQPAGARPGADPCRARRPDGADGARLSREPRAVGLCRGCTLRAAAGAGQSGAGAGAGGLPRGGRPGRAGGDDGLGGGRLRRPGRGPDRHRARERGPLQPPDAQSRALPLAARAGDSGRAGEPQCPLGRGHGAVCRVPVSAAKPTGRGRRDPDAAGAAEPLRAARSGAGGWAGRGDH
ncbi:toll/interleukin-1 receptor domain-containing protein [uncultured Thiodictyon sp.]|uniref:toll/interleukin-1 receptor domain-containing protein n=1 Tax=uncultured Thiodictyon sp. TaxID=1846217 RepID=UPI0034530C4B